MKKILIISLLLILSSCWNNNKEIFENKQKCLSYENEIKELINEDKGKFLELFYSPTNNTCIYIYNQENNQFIIDYMTKETIFYCDWNIRTLDKCYDKTKELKWE